MSSTAPTETESFEVFKDVLKSDPANLDFSCVGCGRCCTGHHVPLTLDEARQWADDGGQVIILLEAFLEDPCRRPPDRELAHVLKRSAQVISGGVTVHVAVNIAAFNPAECRHLDADKLCRIYDRRPLVCRIYPMETNPTKILLPSAKDCPSEAWQPGAAYLRDGLPAQSDLAELIQRSRRADYGEVSRRAALCADLGLTTLALKGDGFTAYLPDMGAFAKTLERSFAASEEAQASEAPWAFVASSLAVAEQLAEAGVALTDTAGSGGLQFIPVRG